MNKIQQIKIRQEATDYLLKNNEIPDTNYWLAKIDSLLQEKIDKIATIKRWVKTFRDNETGEMTDEYVIRDIDLQNILKE